jgi:hypothetical protein
MGSSLSSTVFLGSYVLRGAAAARLRIMLPTCADAIVDGGPHSTAGASALARLENLPAALVQLAWAAGHLSRRLPGRAVANPRARSRLAIRGRRPVEVDGSPRHPPILLLRQLHRRLVCPQADGAGPGTHRAVLSQPIGHRPENPDVMYNLSRDVWAKGFRERHPEVSMGAIERYLHNLYRAPPDFVYSVSRDFVRNCQTAMLVLPDDTPAHAYQTAIDVASLAPNAEITVYPWKDPPELKSRTINRVRTFLHAHLPVTAVR